MNYYSRYLAKISDTSLRPAYETHETTPRKSEDSYGDVPTKPTKTDSVGFVGRSLGASTDFTPSTDVQAEADALSAMRRIIWDGASLAESIELGRAQNDEARSKR